ncbi:hypothetical protein ES708_24486 [subsurface metagenome]
MLGRVAVLGIGIVLVAIATSGAAWFESHTKR